MLREKTVGIEVAAAQFDILEKHIINRYEYGERTSDVSVSMDAIKRCFSNLYKRTVFESETIQLTSVGYVLLENLSESVICVNVKICLKTKTDFGLIHTLYIGDEYIRGRDFENLIRNMGIITPI